MSPIAEAPSPHRVGLMCDDVEAGDLVPSPGLSLSGDTVPVSKIQVYHMEMIDSTKLFLRGLPFPRFCKHID